tara:strand:+ start:825 stop:1559 length:735 start_codon:yes stop_codon:yes gene_type:complete
MAKQRIGKMPVYSISVIIPAYNSEKLIVHAIKSIEAQTLPVDEIICVDDASTDRTAKIVKESFPNVKLIRLESNSGPSFARNIGIKAASGNVIAFLDADDVWPEDKIEYFSQKLRHHQEVGIIGGMVLRFEGNQKPDLNLESYFNFYMSSFLIKKSVFQKIGYFDEAMRLSEDQDWFFRVREAGMEIVVYKKISLFVRIHSNNTTKDLNTMQIGLTEALRKSMKRRRGVGANQDLSEISIIDEE